MALDVGSKTIGIATSDALRMLATPLTTLKRGKLAVDLASLGELTTKHQIKALAVGLPLNMDGTEGPRCQSTRQFVANIANHGPPALGGPAGRPAGRTPQHGRRDTRHDRRLRHDPRQTGGAYRCRRSSVDPGERAGAIALGTERRRGRPWRNVRIERTQEGHEVGALVR